MDVKALQTRLRDFAAAREWQQYHAPKNLAMALMVEAAELLELFQWQTLTESRGFTRDPRNKERVADEIADVLLYLLQLADHTDVDVEQAVERKLHKNAQKHPAKHSPPPAVAPAPAPDAHPAPVAAVPKAHLLVDWENVQPTSAALKALVPEGTDVWLFHGPNQRVDDSGHREAYGDSVTRVPRSGAGRNALDFQLTYYVGYITARQPNATFVVVSNDQGYDPMLEHARDLGFKARRCGHARVPTQACVPPVPLVPLISPAPSAAVATLPSKPSPKALHAVASATATRKDVQRLAAVLQGMQPGKRPARKDALLTLLQAHLGEIGRVSPRVSHALSQLQAQKLVALKKDAVSYPPRPPASDSASAPTSAPTSAPKPAPAPAKKKFAPAKAKVPATPAKKSTAAQVAHAVLASLQKMPHNKPTRRAGLLKFIETHATLAADPPSMALQVCTLLQARKEVALCAAGQRVSYPKIQAKRASSA